MNYLIDTDVVINALNGRQQDDLLLQRLSSQELFISLITYGEIYEGIYSSRNPTIDEPIFRRFLRGVDVLPLTKLIMRRFARIRGELRRAGTIIGDTDILIAATALQHNLTLVTHNTQHFQRVPDLLLY